jgi:secondary thiamine-phosphate synthase enzyme
MRSHPIAREAVKTTKRDQIVDVTPNVRKLIKQFGVDDGMAIVYVPHTTAAVTINENADPDVKSDMLAKLSAMIPRKETYYDHDEGNSDSHVKTAIVGNSATVLIERGNLVLGTWQGIYFCEFDGPRNRELLIKVVDFRPSQD